MTKKVTDDKKYNLPCENRTLMGKKLKKIRKEGKIPANIYGESFTSTAIQCTFNDFIKIYKKAKETQVVNIQIDKKEIPVLIHQVQYHPTSNSILHIDFRKVNLLKKIQTEVPVKIIGESEAIKSNAGVLMVLAEEIKVEALPTHIPSEIVVDISKLAIGDEILIKSIKLESDCIVVDDENKVIVRIVEHKEEKIEPEIEAKPIEEEVEGEKKEGEEAEGEKKEESKGEAVETKQNEDSKDQQKEKQSENKPA